MATSIPSTATPSGASVAPSLAEQELRRRLSQVEAVYRMADALGRAVDPAEIFREGLDCVCRSLDATRAGILLFDADGALRCRAWENLSESFRRVAEAHSPWPAGTPDVRAICIADAGRDPALDAALRRALVQEGIGAVVFVPLSHQGSLLGGIAVCFDAPHEFGADELRVAGSVADHLAFAIERRRAHEALCRSKREFEALAEHSPDVIVRFDRDYRQLYVNPAIEQATGRPAADFIGRTKRESHDDEITDIWEAAIDRVLDTGDAVDFEFRFDTPYGPRYFVCTLRPEIVEDGIVQTVIGTTRDVTDLKVAELRQRLLAEVGAALVTDLDYRDALTRVVCLVAGTFFDACAIDITGEDGALERIADRSRNGEDVDTLARSREPEAVRRIPLAARGRTIGMITFVAPDGRTFDDDERTFAHELAGRVALAIDNLLLYWQAADANRTKSNFMATMSHELRTPLNAIIGYADLMDMNIGGPLTELQTTHLSRIRYSANHLLTVIEEILTFSRAEAGREEIRFGTVDVAEIVREAASLVETAAAAKSLRLHTDLPVQAIPLRTDAVKLRQVVLNLLSNAVKFTDRGSVTVTVSNEPGAVRIAVDDTGIGIDPDDLECVFDPFWQARSGSTRTIGGTGLGLTVSRQLVSLLGGEITASSRPGAGSRFEIGLPLGGVRQDEVTAPQDDASLRAV